jgi:NADH dehydrogenase
LHEVAAGTLDAHQEGLSYTVLAGRNHFSFSLGEMAGIDIGRKTITLAALQDERGEPLLPTRHVGFDKLVLAVGSGSNSFGTPGIEHAHRLENVADAQRFHNEWLNACLRASFEPREPVSVAIVGAGATGVELSAELTEAHTVIQASLPASQRFGLAITLIEGGPRILGALPERTSAQAQAALVDKGVRVMTGTRVQALQAGRLILPNADGGTRELPAQLIVWAAGIQAADENTRYGLAVNPLNQFVVDAHLRTTAPDIYAMGDCAAAPWVDGKTVPARAQAANQQATYLAKALTRADAGPGFAYRDMGSLVSLGDHAGVGSLMGSLSGRKFFVQGLLAKWMYMSLHLMHHAAILGVARTASLALARLLQHRASGRLKLH